MLALTGLATILLVLTAILTNRLSPMVALIGIPLLATIPLGLTSNAGGYVGAGIVTVAPMAAMFLFAILFFGILSDAGLFRPMVHIVVRLTRDHPARVTLGTAILTSIVHMDGSGAATFLIVVPALLPVYERLGMDRRLLACVVAMAAGVGNMLPWGGPTIRAATALNLPVMELFLPVLPVYAVGLGTMLLLAWTLGHRERVRMVATGGIGTSSACEANIVGDVPATGPRFWINLALVIAVITTMFTTWLPPAPAFMVGAVLALLINFRDPLAQRHVIEAHAPAAVTMVGILFAAGAFTGIMQGSGMLDALAHSGTAVLPDGTARHLPAVIAVAGMPLSLLFDPDSYYFGILPVLGGIAQNSGTAAIQVGQASILGQMTTGFPVSPMTPATFLLVGLARVELADHQRYTIPFLFLLTLIMAIAAVLLGVISL